MPEKTRFSLKESSWDDAWTFRDPVVRKTIIIGSIFGLVAMGLFGYYYFITPINPTAKTYIAGVVQYSHCEHGSVMMTLSDGNRYWLATRSEEDLSNEISSMCAYLIPGDSIYKHGGTDTISVIRGTQRHYWLVWHK